MKTDVLILGGGLAGFTAARGALGKNLRVLLAEDGYGASPWVHGFNCPVLPGDSPELFLQDTLRSGQGLSEPKLAEALCGDARKVLVLSDVGLQLARRHHCMVAAEDIVRPVREGHLQMFHLEVAVGIARKATAHSEGSRHRESRQHADTLREAGTAFDVKFDSCTGVAQTEVSCGIHNELPAFIAVNNLKASLFLLPDGDVVVVLTY